MNKDEMKLMLPKLQEWVENEDAEMWCVQAGVVNSIIDNPRLDHRQECYQIRYKPQTILVNGIEVPAPVKAGTIKEGQIYYYPVLNSDKYGSAVYYHDYSGHMYREEMGLIYLDLESAKKRAEAMLKFV